MLMKYLFQKTVVHPTGSLESYKDTLLLEQAAHSCEDCIQLCYIILQKSPVTSTYTGFRIRVHDCYAPFYLVCFMTLFNVSVLAG